MAPDGTSVFETTADYEQSALDYYQEQFDRWIGAPFSILWDDYRGRFGILVVALYILMGTLGTVLVPEPQPNMGPRLLGPFEHPNYILGTDGMGQGLLSLMVHSTPAMFKMILSGAIFGSLMSVTLALIAGYKGGTTDKAIMTVTDTLMAIPGLPLLLILAAVLQPRDPFLVGIILNIQGWAGGVRTLRAQVIPLADEAHVEAARAQGQPLSNLLVKEILPHLLPLIFIGLLGGAVGIVTASVGLYFLGILPFTNQNWGVVLNYAYQSSGALYSLEAAHWLLVPLVTIVGLNLGLTLLAQAFDQVFNPRVRARHRRRNVEAEVEEDIEPETTPIQQVTQRD
jgi:peptide/nickel transport system permease protein